MSSDCLDLIFEHFVIVLFIYFMMMWCDESGGDFKF